MPKILVLTKMLFVKINTINKYLISLHLC